MLPVPTSKPAPYVRPHALTTPSTDTQSTTIKKWTSLRMKTAEPDAKQPARIPQPQQVLLPYNIGKYVVCNAEAVTRLGWTEFLRWRWGRGDFASLSEVKNLARHFLRQYKHPGAPVVLMTGEWLEGERLAALKRGPQRPSPNTPLFSVRNSPRWWRRGSEWCYLTW